MISLFLDVPLGRIKHLSIVIKTSAGGILNFRLKISQDLKVTALKHCNIGRGEASFLEAVVEAERIKKLTLGIFVPATSHSNPVFTVKRLSEPV